VTAGGAACVSDPIACPKGYGNSAQLRALVEGFCLGSNPALCLQTERDEAFPYPDLGNFEGMLTVPPQTGGVTYYFAIQSAESDWADDKDYQFFVEWLSDPQETSFYMGNPTKQNKVANFNVDGPPPANFPYPPNPGATVL